MEGESEKEKCGLGLCGAALEVKSRRRGRVGAGEERGGVSAGWSLSGGGAGRKVVGGRGETD